MARTARHTDVPVRRKCADRIAKAKVSNKQEERGETGSDKDVERERRREAKSEAKLSRRPKVIATDTAADVNSAASGGERVNELTVPVKHEKLLLQNTRTPILKVKLIRRRRQGGLSKEDLEQCLSEEDAKIAREMASLLLREAKERKAAKVSRESNRQHAEAVRSRASACDDQNCSEKGAKMLRIKKDKGKSGSKVKEQQDIPQNDTPIVLSEQTARESVDSPLSLPSGLWASSRRFMSECSPVFPDGTFQVKQSSGGFAIGLLLSQSRWMTSIHLSGQQLTLHITDLSNKKNQISALNKSCHTETTISVFAETNSISPFFPCPTEAKFIFVGEYQFMEWKSESDRHRIVLQRRQEPCIKRRYYYNIPQQTDLSLNLFQGIACPTCHCALPAADWAGWTCHHCSCSTAAPPIQMQLHRYFAKVNISYSGPRMDNGKAVLNQSTEAKRHLTIWSDGIKSAHYLLSPSNDGVQLYHLLCSSEIEADSTRLLNLLLDRNMPYRRCTHKMTFHASFRAPDINHHLASALYTCHADGTATPSAVIELIDALDESVSRFVTESMEGFNDVSITLSQGESIDLLIRAEEAESIAAHRAIYHLGPAAQVSIRERASGKETASLSLSHGDVLYLPFCEALGREYYMKVLHSEVSLTCIARCLSHPSS